MVRKSTAAPEAGNEEPSPSADEPTLRIRAKHNLFPHGGIEKIAKGEEADVARSLAIRWIKEGKAERADPLPDHA